jgi:serine/threonine protein kinase
MRPQTLISAVRLVCSNFGLDETRIDTLQPEPCGAGGQSIAYSLWLPSGERFCVKLAHEGKGTVHLEREAHFLEALKSDRFPALILNGVGEGFIVEEFVEGVRFTPENREFLLRNIKNIARDLEIVLRDLTNRAIAIIHRDLKPNNLRLRNGRVVVLDLGSAEYEGARRPLWPTSFPKLGRKTHVFQPFEQLCSQPTQDRRVDVFAAASVVFALIEGSPPYDNARAGYLEAKAYYESKEAELTKRLRNYPAYLGKALFDALRVEPNERAEDLRDVAAAVERAF